MMTLIGSYAAHERLVAPARPGAALWRLFAGLVLVGVIVTLGNLTLGAGLQSSPQGRALLADGGASPVSLLILLASFGFVTLGVFVSVRLLHRRNLLGLIGSPRVAMSGFLRVLGALCLLGLVLFLLPPWGMGLPLERNLPAGLWVSLLPLSLLCLLIQTSAEEILFRGYIQQQLAARFSSPVIWMVVPSALFAVGHYLPVQAGPNAPMIALWAGLFGLLMADLTARSGSLGPAIAVHFANNLSSLLIVALPDGLSGLSLFTVGFSMDDAEAVGRWLPIDFATMIVAWLAARLALRR